MDISFKTAIGFITISEKNKKIVNIKFTLEGNDKTSENKILNDCKNQILGYFEGNRKEFDCELELNGTDFQKKVWTELLKIKYGKTISYKELAEKIGSPKSYRAVANANRQNPIPLIVPCHRVIGSNGKLVGYAYGIDKKKFLLDLENVNSRN